jgi:hypothetical protein
MDIPAGQVFEELVVGCALGMNDRRQAQQCPSAVEFRRAMATRE